ncbi:MAG: chromate efflux transporter [Solimonas sp.]
MNRTYARQSVLEVLRVFLKLGLTSFGGPIAHLGYYHREFVVRRGWLDEARYAQLLAPSQFLPGPSSTQFGFSVGLLRAGWLGGLAAFCAFTLPSALLLFAFAAFGSLLGGKYGEAVLHGLKLMAVVVVAQGVLAMARTLTPDWPRRLLAMVALAFMLAVPAGWSQLAVIVLGAALGPLLCRSVEPRNGAALSLGYGRRTGAALLALFTVLLFAASLLAHDAPLLLRAAAALYKIGALVFGGGHVVLPLLTEAVVDSGWLSQNEFLAGYGAAQAVPGPMFSVAAFIGARLNHGEGGVLGAAVCLVSIFLPGLLLIAGLLPFWNRLSSNAGIARSMAGVNAAVVGLLAAALYNPLWVSAVSGVADFLIALLGFLLLVAARLPALAVVAWCVLARLAVTALGG